MVESLKILVVDDNEALCGNISAILELKGYAATKAYNGKNAIELFKKNKYDLVLLDIKLSDISGIEVLKILKGLAPDVEIIMLTAFAEDAFNDNDLKAYNFEIMQKPFDFDDLLAKIKAI
ncbi:MAG: response regulator [Candidatus Omnitrophica bacterium]|nr:response regulator [Candidatus Omnitrophota bacterium]